MKQPDRDRGVTMIELLVAVVLMGLAFGAVFGGLGLFFKIQNTQTSNSAIDVQLRNYAESVLSQTYKDCAKATDYTGAGKAVAPSGYTGTVVVKYWDGNITNAAFGTTCTADKGLQQITLTLTDSNQVKGTLVIGKSR